MRSVTPSLLGAAALVLAQAGPGPDPTAGWPSWIINGGVGAVAIYAIVWLIGRHNTTIEKMSAEFKEAIGKKDQQILDQGKEFKEAVERQHAENRDMLREMRVEHQSNVEKQFALSREQVAALEHVTAGMKDLKNAVETLAGRVDEIDPRPKRPPRNPPPPT